MAVYKPDGWGGGGAHAEPKLLNRAGFPSREGLRRIKSGLRRFYFYFNRTIKNQLRRLKNSIVKARLRPLLKRFRACIYGQEFFPISSVGKTTRERPRLGLRLRTLSTHFPTVSSESWPSGDELRILSSVSSVRVL